MSAIEALKSVLFLKHPEEYAKISSSSSDEDLSNQAFILSFEVDDYQLLGLSLTAGANPDTLIFENESPLRWAIKEDRQDVGELLIAHNASCDDSSHEEPLIHFAVAQYRGWAIELIGKNCEDINCRNSECATAISSIIFSIDQHGVDVRALVKLLLEHGADIDCANGGDGLYGLGNSAIEIATSLNCLDVVQFVVSCGIEIDELRRGLLGKTLLMEAAHAGHWEICEFLLENGASATLTTVDGRNSLWFAHEPMTVLLFINNEEKFTSTIEPKSEDKLKCQSLLLKEITKGLL